MSTLSKSILPILAFSCLFVSSITPSGADDAVTQLKVGDRAPVFKSVDDEGHVWNSTHHVGMTPIVVYFSPGDFKFCSIRQAQKYQKQIEELTRYNVQVIGISGDSPETHRLFKKIHGFSYTLLSDSHGAIASKFGVPLRKGSSTPITDMDGRTKRDSFGKAVKAHRGVTHRRWTFIIGRDGTIIHKNTRVSPVKDCEDVLEFIKQRSQRKTIQPDSPTSEVEENFGSRHNTKIRVGDFVLP